MGLVIGSLGATGGLGTNSYLEANLLFPYTNGLDFVTTIKKRGGWEAVDAAYRKPPESTEQVMHPEKYLAGEAPAPVQTPDLARIAGPGWETTFENVMGEFDVVEMLQAGIPASRARRAAAGWGGGAISFAEGPEGKTLMAMGDALERRYEGLFDLEPLTAPVLKTEDGVWLLVQKGAKVAVVQAPDQALGEAAVKAVS